MHIGTDAVPPSVPGSHPDPGYKGQGKGQEVPSSRQGMTPTQKVEEDQAGVKEEKEEVQEFEHRKLLNRYRARMKLEKEDGREPVPLRPLIHRH